MDTKIDTNKNNYKNFYNQYTNRYWHITQTPTEQRYTSASNTLLKNDYDLFTFLSSIIPKNAYGLDAGCGPGARDVMLYQQAGFNIQGIDAVAKNIELAVSLHPSLENKVATADISTPLLFNDKTFDFLLCNCVIQHILPEDIQHTTIPEFARVLKPQGIIQLMFKVGSGYTEVYDPEYGVNRSFILYEPSFIIDLLSTNGLEILPEVEGGFAGVTYFTDPKPMPHCVIFARKTGQN